VPWIFWGGKLGDESIGWKKGRKKGWTFFAGFCIFELPQGG